MTPATLFSYQEDALAKMKNGCILNGGVGSGKSRTAVAYYYIMNGGSVNTEHYIPMVNPCDLYIITTAKKRDTKEWEGELAPFLMSYLHPMPRYHQKIIVDSWNNIHNYINVEHAFFIFDEQRVVGWGAWTKSFLKITDKNRWVLLSATPGDTWLDYRAVFIANKFYRNKTDFTNQHVVYSRFTPYPKVEKYINVGKLEQERNSILIKMDFSRKTIRHHQYIFCTYNANMYDDISRNRWNIYTNQPIKTASEYCMILRKLVNSDVSRQNALLDVLKDHPKLILFYSYDYELEILRKLLEGFYPYSEWNGHKHEPMRSGSKWVYLVEYTAGCEGWNCVTTDTIVFYSQNYSYKVMEQASGRIDRLNTPYTDLYYYHFLTTSKIDKAITGALRRKKKFNEVKFAPIFENKKEIK